MRHPKTLFARTGLTIAIAMLLFLLFSGGVIFYYILGPVARQAADDLAALMVLSSKTWVELPPETRPDFEDELRTQHRLTLTHSNTPLDTLVVKSPFMHFLEDALSQRLETDIPIMLDSADRDWFWVDIPVADQRLRIGFSHDRIQARPPVAVLLLILGACIITLLTSLLLVRRLTRPLARLAEETSRFGRGERPDSLSEEGPEELALLARNFNRMTGQVQQLLTNRTTLLGGISHDLRTPIARLRLALELISTENDPKLLEGMHHDLEEMNHLITRTLELARGMEGASRDIETIDLGLLISELVSSHESQGVKIEWRKPPACLLQTNPVALNRVLTNLLENAICYGQGKPVSVALECDAERVIVTLTDHGPGISEDQLDAVFQPFYRLEGSRSRSTGGSGLGLAIVKQLCDIYGWKVRLQPHSEGGLIACLTIPKSCC
ncbi:MAG: ATP-binding protein [Candidatus Polarisedimenticolaceae bacterium]|nr:ATP-binding protein [Candidatus Polarisedimenticolaceae bacterium]